MGAARDAAVHGSEHRHGAKTNANTACLGADFLGR